MQFISIEYAFAIYWRSLTMTSTLIALTGSLAFVLGSLLWVFKR